MDNLQDLNTPKFGDEADVESSFFISIVFETKESFDLFKDLAGVLGCYIRLNNDSLLFDGAPCAVYKESYKDSYFFGGNGKLSRMDLIDVIKGGCECLASMNVAVGIVETGETILCNFSEEYFCEVVDV